MNKIMPQLLLFCIIILFCSSCKKKDLDEMQKEPDYSAFISNSNSNTYPTAHNPNDLENPHSESNKKNNIDREWPYELTFNGIVSNKKYKTGNLNTNYKFSGSPSALVCPDNDNNVIYYVNYGKDNFIYQLKDGVSTLLVEKNAHSLQLWNNELYFISNVNKTDYYTTGDIYCFNLKTEELRLIRQASADLLYIDTHGIFFHDFNENGVYNGFTLDINTTTLQQVDYIFPASYNEFQVLASKDGIFLLNNDTSEEIFLAPEEYMNNMLSLSDEYFIFTDQSYIYTLNLISGEKKIFDLNDYESLSYDITFIFDLIVIDNIIYATDGASVFKLDITNNQIERYVAISIDSKDRYNIKNLFTDKYNIYALVSYAQGSAIKMMELTLDKNENESSPFTNIIKPKELIE